MKEDGGPAFPSGEKYTTWDSFSATSTEHSKGPLIKGMSLREYFAAKAIQGYLAAPDMPANWTPARYAQAAYEMADAMIAERNKAT
jgi:hypothetical protein